MSEEKHTHKLKQMLGVHANVLENPSREAMIQEALTNREAMASATGALATWTPVVSAGRQPKDTYMVRDEETEVTVDWSSS